MRKYLILAYRIFILIICLVALIVSWKRWGFYKNTNEFNKKFPLNWDKNLISSIQIVKNDQDCPSSYQPIILAQLFNQNNTDYSLNKFKRNPLDIFKEQVVNTHTTKFDDKIHTFAFINSQTNEVQSWKICAKYMNDTSFSNKKDQLVGLCTTDEQICPTGNNKVICISNSMSCPPINNQFKYCPVDKKQCDQNSLIECVNPKDECELSELKQCKITEKICIVQDRAVCVNQNEKCPILDIKILSKTQQSLSDYEEETISFASNYKLFVKRNDPTLWPISELAIQNDQNECLQDVHDFPSIFEINQIQQCQLNQCQYGKDTRYEEIFSDSLSTKQLFLVNNIIEQNDEVKSQFNKQFKLYKRHYFSFKTSCSHTEQFDGYNVDSPGIVSIFDPALSSLIFILFLLNQLFHMAFNCIKTTLRRKLSIFIRQQSYFFALIFSVINFILFLAIDWHKLSQFNDYNEMLIDEECTDTYFVKNIQDVKLQIDNIRKFQKAQLALQIIVIIILVIYIKIEIHYGKKSFNDLDAQHPDILSYYCICCATLYSVFASNQYSDD